MCAEQAMTDRGPKKSESIEVRLSHEAKQALMSKAGLEGRSASEILRECIGRYLNPPREKTRSQWKLWQPVVAIGLGSVALLFAYSLSTPATAVPNLRPMFESLDKDHNGLIDPREYAGQRIVMLTSNGSSGGPVMLQMTDPSNTLASSYQLRADFAGADTNEDGVVSYEEFAAYRRSVRHRGFAISDADANGWLSLREFQQIPGVAGDAAGRKLFESRDANHDGQLSEAEFYA
jgi:Ca2+-binding EF-hand superfamily protein